MDLMQHVVQHFCLASRFCLPCTRTHVKPRTILYSVYIKSFNRSLSRCVFREDRETPTPFLDTYGVIFAVSGWSPETLGIATKRERYGGQTLDLTDRYT